MAQMRVIGANGRVLQECANIQIEDQGVLTEDQSGEMIGFFPFRGFQHVVSKQSSQGQSSHQSQAANQTDSYSQSQSQTQPQSQR